MSDIEKLSYFIKGLTPTLQAHITIAQGPSSFSSAVESARKKESAIQQIQAIQNQESSINNIMKLQNQQQSLNSWKD